MHLNRKSFPPGYQKIWDTKDLPEAFWLDIYVLLKCKKRMEDVVVAHDLTLDIPKVEEMVMQMTKAARTVEMKCLNLHEFMVMCMVAGVMVGAACGGFILFEMGLKWMLWG